jgi:hypothetical protein
MDTWLCPSLAERLLAVNPGLSPVGAGHGCAQWIHGRSGPWCRGNVLVRMEALAGISTEHAVPLVDESIEPAVGDARCRGLDDTLTITGSETGELTGTQAAERTRGCLLSDSCELNAHPARWRLPKTVSRESPQIVASEQSRRST